MKDLKISKELVCVVLNIPKEAIVDIYTDGNYLLIRKINSRVEEHNIYEFAYKWCKEWAFKNNYKIQSQINESNKGHSHITKKNDDCWAKGFFENTEIEVIIKSCEFILTKKESK